MKAALASLAAIIFWLRTAGTEADPRILALLFLTILLSWAFIHVMFALHYAHEYYAEHRGQGGGLRFPGNTDPNYWDFIYFAFAIGTATQVSDVAVTSREIRRTVTMHGIVAFVFNVTLIALPCRSPPTHQGELDAATQRRCGRRCPARISARYSRAPSA